MSDCKTTKELDDMRDQPRSTYKRRSSVFQLVARRNEETETTIDVDNAEADNNDEEAESGDADTAEAGEAFDLPAYIEQLKNERKEWKETLKARKSRRRNLQKQKAIVQKHGADFDLSILSESERSFLLERPHYERICKNIKTLTDAAVKVATLNREIERLNDRLTLKMEQKLLYATKKVIDMASET